jgi:hypothetical protein
MVRVFHPMHDEVGLRRFGQVPLTLYEADRDNASLALPRRSARGVAVTSLHYTLNVSPVWVFLPKLQQDEGTSLVACRKLRGWVTKAEAIPVVKL